MSIRPYAITYPQMLNQAIAQGLPKADLARLADACRHAEHFLDGMYRGQGVPFICHSMRTASIVLTERQPLDVVIASLLHAVYMMATFSDREVGCVTPAHRAEVRRAVGETVEQWIIDYDRLPWRKAGELEAHLKKLPTYPERTRQLLIMRTANELEDYLDAALSYREGDALQDRADTGRKRVVELAEALGLKQLAAELQEAAELSKAVHIPEDLRRQACFAYEHPAHKKLRANWPVRLRSRLRRIKKKVQPSHADH